MSIRSWKSAALVFLFAAWAAPASAQVIATRYPNTTVVPSTGWCGPYYDPYPCAPYVAPVVVSPIVHETVVTPSVRLVYPDAVTPSRDPYDTHGIVVVGAGVGGFFFLGRGAPTATMDYTLHLGLAVKQAEFAVDLDLVPTALSNSATGGRTGLYAFGSSFRYRFLPDADLHPVAGFGLEGLAVEGGHSSIAFGANARVGLELAYPISDGALALGIDVAFHHVFGNDAFPPNLTDALSVGAHVHYRF